MDTRQRSRQADARRRSQSTARKSRPTGAQQAKRRPEASARQAPEVVYTPPKPFNRNKLLLRLLTVVLVVMALLFGISIFFKVEVITVSGAEKYSAWTVREASGIEEGDNLLTFGKAKACGQITAKLPYVESVRIGIKLPDTVNIEITELDVVYAIRDSAGGWWLMTAQGMLVEGVDSAAAGDHTRIQGVRLADPQPGQIARAAEPEESQEQTDPSGESTQQTIPTVVTAVREADRLDAVLQILTGLEENEIVGDAASIDVSDLGSIELWYADQYQVNLGDTSRLAYKLACLKQVLDTLPDYESGSIDLSFTVMPDQPVYTRFES